MSRQYKNKQNLIKIAVPISEIDTTPKSGFSLSEMILDTELIIIWSDTVDISVPKMIIPTVSNLDFPVGYRISEDDLDIRFAARIIPPDNKSMKASAIVAILK